MYDQTEYRRLVVCEPHQALEVYFDGPYIRPCDKPYQELDVGFARIEVNMTLPLFHAHRGSNHCFIPDRLDGYCCCKTKNKSPTPTEKPPRHLKSRTKQQVIIT